MDETMNNLTYGQALEHLKQGRPITRAVWGGYWMPTTVRGIGELARNLCVMLAHTKYGQVGPAQPYWDDMLANDWKVLSQAEVSLCNQKIAVWAPGQHKGTYNLNLNMEQQASEGLDTTGYAGKWGKAKTYADGLFPDGNTKEHWDAVRLHFLELGGDWSKSMPMMSSGEEQPIRSMVTPARTALL